MKDNPGKAGGIKVLGEGRTTDSRSVTHLTRIRHRIARWLAPDLFCPYSDYDLGRQIDHLVDENDRLRDRIRELEGCI